MILLAIDPGSAGAGNACAVFVQGELARARFARAVLAPLREVTVSHVAIERPAVQGDRTRAARPQDLMGLAWSGALLAGYIMGRDGAAISEYTPAEWKGSEPKPIQHKRLWEVLSPEEHNALGGAATFAVIRAAQEKGALARWKISGAACYPRSFTTHNLLDAAALGCYHLGRLNKVG